MTSFKIPVPLEISGLELPELFGWARHQLKLLKIDFFYNMELVHSAESDQLCVRVQCWGLGDCPF